MYDRTFTSTIVTTKQMDEAYSLDCIKTKYNELNGYCLSTHS